MGIVGGDAPALFGFANEVRARRAAIESACQQLGSLVESANWVGPDRDAFVHEWNSRYRTSLLSVLGDLETVASQVVTHARAQDEATR